MRRPRHAALAVGMEEPVSGRWRGEEGHVNLRAEKRRRHINVFGARQDLEQQVIVVEGVTVAGERYLIISAAIDIVEDHAMRASFRRVTKLINVQTSVEFGHYFSSATTVCFCLPRPSIASSMRSPTFRYCGGF